jgi:hypothetical protein
VDGLKMLSRVVFRSDHAHALSAARLFDSRKIDNYHGNRQIEQAGILSA